MKKLLLALALLVAPGLAVAADGEVKITGKLFEVAVDTADGPVMIRRNQDLEATIQGDYAKVARKCPPFCIQPIQAAPGVATIGELELLDLIKKGGDAVLVDARTEDWYVKGTIPGSINIPYTEISMRLNELGCAKSGDKWDCGKARKVALFCNGVWCAQSPIAINAMIREGYPAKNIHYYRGGMQSWLILGFNTVEGSL